MKLIEDSLLSELSLVNSVSVSIELSLVIEIDCRLFTVLLVFSVRGGDGRDGMGINDRERDFGIFVVRFGVLWLVPCLFLIGTGIEEDDDGRGLIRL